MWCSTESTSRLRQGQLKSDPEPRDDGHIEPQEIVETMRARKWEL